MQEWPVSDILEHVKPYCKQNPNSILDAPILKEKKVTKAAHGATKAQEESMDIDVIE